MTVDYSLLEGLRDGALVVDQQQQVVYANAALLKTCGLSGAEVLGRKCRDALGGFRFLCGEQGHENCLHKRVIRTGRSVMFTCLHAPADGSQKTYQVVVCPLKNHRDETEQTLRIVREVEDEEFVTGPLGGNVLQQEAILRKYSPFFHCFLSREKNLLYLTPNLAEMTGKNAAEVINRPCWEIFANDDTAVSGGAPSGPCPECRVEEVLTQGRSVSFKKSHALGDFEIIATPIRNHEGEIIGVLTSGADVTQLMQTQAALKETAANYDYLFNNLSDAVFIMDRTGQLLDVNRVAEARLGYTKEEFLKMSPREFNAPEHVEGVKDRLRQIWEKGYLFFETVHVARDGRHIPTEINGSVIEYRGRPVVIAVARDITERKTAQRALLESEHRFRELFLNMTNGVAIYQAVDDGEDFIFKDLNPAGRRSSKVRREEIVGLSVRDVFPGVVDMGLFEVLQRVYRTGQPEHHPSAHYRDDVLQAWYENYVYKLPSGELVAVYEDITERKVAEDELRRSEQRYFSLYNNSHAVMLVIEPTDGRILDANPAACAFYGYDRDEFLELKISDINMLAPDEVQQKISQVLAREESAFHFQHRLKDGDVRNVEVFSGPIDIGERTVLFSIVHDVTDRFQAQQEAARRKAEWDKTFDGMADIITIQDPNMRIVRANRAAGEFFAVEPEVLEGQKCHEAFRESAEPCQGCPLCSSFKDLESHSQVIRHQKLGKIFQVSSTPIFTEAGEVQYMVHVAKDITEQKQLEDELFQAHKMEAMGTLAGGIAHDFNNILSAIVGFIQLAQMEPVDEQESEDALDKALVASYRARDLVNQILTFSRKGGTMMEPVEPHLIVKESLKLLRATIPTSIEIREEIAADCGTVLSDPTKLQQIMVNLCTNALHAMEDHKGVLTVKLSRTEIRTDDPLAETVLRPGPFILLTVSDTGVGMTPQVKERIFEPYFTTKEFGKGTGMGLAMVHSIVQRSGGLIQVESAPEAGSTFRVYLPAITPDAPTEAAGDEDPGDLTGEERILVVDDEQEIALLLEKGLERFGYQVTRLTSSTAALAAFKADPDRFDLIISDQTMPDLTGADLAREVLAVRPGMPIILCTGYSSSLTEDSALKMGISRYLMKPVNIKVLARAVRSVCDAGKD